MKEPNDFSNKPGMLSGLEKPEGSRGKVWHVIYVKARHEKCVSGDLVERGIESYLPLRKELRQWSDRKKWIEVPLFSCYVFVRIYHSELGKVYLTNGFVKFVSSNGKPCVVPDNQIESIQKLVEYYPSDVDVLEGDYSGYGAEVIAGPLVGLHGEIIELVNGKNFVVRIEGLDKLLSVKVPVGAVRLISRTVPVLNSQLGVGTAGFTSART